ncbi:MAG: YncE family protein, partial [Methylocella sp.]
MRSDNGKRSGAAWGRGFVALCAVLAMGLDLMATAAGAAPFAYVTNGGNANAVGTVSVIDTATNKVVATVPVRYFPYGVAVAPDGKHAYVANFQNFSISVIATATNTVVATVFFPEANAPDAVAVTPDGQHVYVATQAPDVVLVIDTATNILVATVQLPVGSAPFGVAVTPDGKHAYVVARPDSGGSGSVSVIDTATNTVVATIPAGSFSASITVTPDGKHVYVGNGGSNSVSVIDTATNTVEAATIPVGGAPSGVAVTPDGKHVYVANVGTNNVSVIATDSNTVVATVPVGNFPIAVAITPDGQHAYVTNYSDNTVSVIATASNTVVATIPVGSSGSEANAIAIVPPPPGVPFVCPGNTTGRVFVASGPPLQADVTIQNNFAGISSISTVELVNCTVSPALPETFTPPNTSTIPLTFTKTDQTKAAEFAVSACRPSGSCCSIDPIFTVLELTTGRWVRQTFAGVPKAEHLITVSNGEPGLKQLHIKVNSERFTTLTLS